MSEQWIAKNITTQSFYIENPTINFMKGTEINLLAVASKVQIANSERLYQLIQTNRLIVTKINNGITVEVINSLNPERIKVLEPSTSIPVPDYYTKQETQARYYNKQDINELLDQLQIDPNLFYDKAYVDALQAALVQAIAQKAALGHNHNDLYYLKAQVDQLIANINLTNYYTKAQINQLLTGKSDINHSHPLATPLQDGLMSAADKGKLDSLTVNEQGTYIHHQDIPSATWTINHALNKHYPSVTIVDSAGDVVWADVKYVSDDTVIVSHSAPFSGKAYLN